MYDYQLCSDEYWRQKAANLDKAALDLLQKTADEILDRELLSVVFKNVPPLSGNPHDYVSLSVFDWPNPDTPDGLPWIHKDGVLNPDFKKYDLFPLRDLCKNVGYLVSCGRMTGETRYFEKAGKFLKCWFLESETAMTPHFDYAQFVPGNPKGSCWGLIDSHFFCGLLESVMSLPYNAQWTQEDAENFRQWFLEYFLWYISDPNPVKEEWGPTNHGSWYDAQFITMALFLGRPELAKRQIRNKTIPRLSVQFLNNGLQPYEVSRTVSLGYSLFNLEAWSRLCAYAKRLGIDLWETPSDDNATVRCAFEFLWPFLQGQKEWIYTQLWPHPKYDRTATMYHEFVAPVAGYQPGMENPCFVDD